MKSTSEFTWYFKYIKNPSLHSRQSVENSSIIKFSYYGPAIWNRADQWRADDEVQQTGNEFSRSA